MKPWMKLLAGLAAAAMLAACRASTPMPAASQPRQSEDSGESPAVTFTDALGHTVTVKSTDTVVSLMGSFSELWLEAGGQLAGVTDDAYSERGLDLPDTVTLLGSYKTPSVEKVVALSPDFVLLSADTGEHVALYETLKSAGVNPVYLSINRFDEYLDALQLLTGMTNRPDLYETRGLAVQKQVDAVLQSVQGKPSPSVLFIRTFSSGFRALGKDSMTGEMLAQLGADNIADRHPSLLKELSMETIIEADPDFIFVITMGADEQKALDVLQQGLMSNPAWEGLSAVKAGRYHILPRPLFHYKPNARWGESYEHLAKLLYGA